jgi:hypothetical protein
MWLLILPISLLVNFIRIFAELLREIFTYNESRWIKTNKRKLSFSEKLFMIERLVNY